MNSFIGNITKDSEELFKDEEQGTAATLASLREISDGLWQTTATLSITSETTREIDTLLNELQKHAKSLPDNELLEGIGIGYVSRISALVKRADFQNMNLLTQSKSMDVLTETKVKDGVRSKVFKTIPSFNLSLDNGPFRLTKDFNENSTSILVLDSHNPAAAFAELESVAICLRKDGGPRRTIVTNIEWTKNPKYICAVLNATIRCTHPDIGDVPVSFDGRSITIEPPKDTVIEAVCLRGPSVGALGHLKTLLSDERCDANAVIAATELALLATKECRKLYREKLEDIKKMEAMTLAVMERIALMTVMPESSVPESAALIAVNTAQMISTSEYNIAESSKDILELMLEKETVKMS